jgi:hypothetical protein
MDSPKYCKYCETEPMVRARRSLWHKVLVPHLRLYKCRICGSKSLLKPNSFPDTVISPRRMNPVTVVRPPPAETQPTEVKPPVVQGQLFTGAELPQGTMTRRATNR